MSGFQRAQTIYDAISGRRSIRQYSSDDVSPDTVRRLISMAVMAPLAHNRQPWPPFRGHGIASQARARWTNEAQLQS